jgi:hypothetical protein
MLPPLSSNGASSIRATPARVVETAILHTLAYVDIFDYPLTAAEIHRYLAGVAAPITLVETLLGNGRLVPGRLATCDGYFVLAGREAIVATRRRRARAARRLWPSAMHYGRILASLPFVRMVAITGSLAVDNVEEDADIDYLVVTANDRLWLCRAFTILIVRLAARRGITLCPNYLLSERALVFREQNLYTAHELAQMIPISGMAVYQEIRRRNDWVVGWLPNANSPPPLPDAPQTRARPPQRTAGSLVEKILSTPLGAALEGWERERKIARFSKQHNRNRAEAQFSADWCKGHFEGHAARVLRAYRERLEALEVEG